MSQKQQKYPASRNRAERVYTLAQNSFNGQLSGVPLSNVGKNFTFRSINIDNHGEWWQGRPGTRLYSNSIPSGTVRAKMDHVKAALVIWQIGTTVYVSDKALTTFTEVTNISGVTITDVDARLQPDGDQAILSTPVGIFRIVLDYDNGYYFYRVNTSQPTTMITEVAEDVDNPYVYNYLYALARIRGTGNRSRVTGDELELETGSSVSDSAERFFSEVAVGDPISLTNDLVIGSLTMPSGVRGMTHYPVYRTKNIGEQTEKGKNNSSAFFLWVEDVPVIKVVSYSTVGGVVTGTTGSFEAMDVGCTITLEDGTTQSIDSYDSGTGKVTLSPDPGDGSYTGAIGTDTVFVASQADTTITKTAGTRDFTTDDVGKVFYWADGGYSHITAFVDVDNLTAQWSEAHTSQACALDPTSRNFSDTIQDDPTGEGKVGLKERELSGKSMYIPMIAYKPLPNANMALRSEGFFLSATRDESAFYYSDIGTKLYSLGQYNTVHQYEETKRPIRDIIPFPNLAVFLLTNGTYSAALNTSKDQGNADVGEYIPKLYPLTEIDDRIGVYHWASVARVNSNLVIAVTHEPAIRMLDGYKWSRRNYAVTQDGKSAVQNYIDSIDVTYDIIATYNMKTGYVLWIFTWVDADSVEVESDLIIDTPDTVDADDEWTDTPDDVESEDEIVDTPGQLPL